MSDFRAVRSFSQLKAYVNWFHEQKKDKKDQILAEMVADLEAYRQKSAHTELKMPPQAEKPLLRRRRRRR